MDFKGAERYAKYGTFSVADESNKYRLTVGNYSGISRLTTLSCRDVTIYSLAVLKLLCFENAFSFSSFHNVIILPLSPSRFRNATGLSRVSHFHPATSSVLLGEKTFVFKLKNCSEEIYNSSLIYVLAARIRFV